ncbi:MAG: hypothetical protein V1787_06795 [Candidatus Micrarchaeota archaeon]
MRPRKSLYFSLPGAKAGLDVSLWDGSEKDGKWLPSSISLRIRRDDETTAAAYCKPGDALKVAAALQGYAFEALEADSARRRAAADAQKQAGAQEPAA